MDAFTQKKRHNEPFTVREEGLVGLERGLDLRLRNYQGPCAIVSEIIRCVRANFSPWGSSAGSSHHRYYKP